MKKLLLTFLIGFSFYFSKAQSFIYHEFPDSNATWNVSWINWGFDGQGQDTYTLGGDTIIYGSTYQKVIQNGYNFQAIREDVAQKKVYIYTFFSTDTTEKLLYDFNLNTGDTLKGYLAMGTGNIVTSVDSILIGSDYRKRWNMKFGTPTTNVYQIIEGIGSTVGLLTPYTDFESASNLDCFVQQSQTFYPYYSASAVCPEALYNSIADKGTNANSMTIFPNPTSGVFNIKTNNKSENMLMITDLLGKPVLEKAIRNGEVEIDFSDYQSGIYFVSAFDKDGNLAVKKIVKE
jgi:hypothetical protein